MNMKDEIRELDTEELKEVSGGQIKPIPKEVEIHKGEEHSGADINAGLDNPGGTNGGPGTSIRNLYTV